MQHLKPLGVRVDVGPLVEKIHAHPELWNAHTLRTKAYGPHVDVPDIWVRFNHIDNFDPEHPYRFVDEHESVWYPSARTLDIYDLVAEVMQIVGGAELGGVLITKVPAGKDVKPHIDQGWHARYYEKVAVQLQSAPGQGFCFEDGCFDACGGDLYLFDNAYTHWVVNPTDVDRMTLIICFRRT